MELSRELQSFQSTERFVRKRIAEKAGVSEGVAAGWGLSPTMAGFFDRLRPYSVEEDATFDEAAAIGDWRDEKDARELLRELEWRELIETREDGLMSITELGRVAIDHLDSIR